MNSNQLFKDQTIITLGTIDKDNTPNLRYVEHQFTEDGKIYFATSNQGSAYKELSNNPNIDIMQFEQGMYTRVRGQVKFLAYNEKKAIKEHINQVNPKISVRYGEDGFKQFIEIGYIINPVVDVRDMRPKNR